MSRLLLLVAAGLLSGCSLLTGSIGLQGSPLPRLAPIVDAFNAAAPDGSAYPSAGPVEFQLTGGVGLNYLRRYESPDEIERYSLLLTGYSYEKQMSAEGGTGGDGTTWSARASGVEAVAERGRFVGALGVFDERAQVERGGVSGRAEAYGRAWVARPLVGLRTGVHMSTIQLLAGLEVPLRNDALVPSETPIPATGLGDDPVRVSRLRPVVQLRLMMAGCELC